jgi:nicotinic acid mononucleotide adenylyltransferase
MQRIGFFPITGDPIHNGHLLDAMKVLQTVDLTTVYLQVCGDIPAYKQQKASKWHRHEMAKMAIKEYEPLLQYTKAGYDGFAGGEDVFVDFVQNPIFAAETKFYYLSGIENQEIVVKAFLNNKSKLDELAVKVELVFISRKKFAPAQQNHDNDIVVNSDLGFSSTLFRNHEKEDMVPKSVLAYCQQHHLYGY